MAKTNTESGSQTVTASGYYLEIITEDGTCSQPELKVSESLVIQAQAGDQYRVVSSQGMLPDNVVATQTDDDLEVRFYNGAHLIIEDYYLVFGHPERKNNH